MARRRLGRGRPAGRADPADQDLDLAIARDDLPAVRAALAGLGFRPDPTAAPGLPARMVLAPADGGQVDLHPLVFDGHGNGWQELGGGAWATYPADGLSGWARSGAGGSAA